MKYDKLSNEIQQRIEYDLRTGSRPDLSCRDSQAVRRRPDRDKPNLWRGPFVRDTEKIMNSAYYNRYQDKTQVFSFYKNDDITHRALHVQLVSRIARNIEMCIRDRYSARPRRRKDNQSGQNVTKHIEA